MDKNLEQWSRSRMSLRPLARAAAAGFAVLVFGGAFASAQSGPTRPSFVPPPAAGEQRLTGADLRALLVDGAIECTDFRESTQDCSNLSRYAIDPRGDVVAGAVMLMSASPRIELAVFARLDILGDAVCVANDTMDIRVLPNDEIDAVRAAEITQVVRTALAAELKPTCSVYSRSGGRLRERTFELVDDAGKEIDPFQQKFSRFLKPGEAEPALRPLDSEDEHDS
jgi:hypothetical protein